MSALPEESVLSVSSLVNRLRNCLEKSFPFVLVRGEITDFSKAPSGHIYFSLKDDASQIKCVWFLKNQRSRGQLFDPMTGEVFEAPRPDPRQLLSNGIEAICAGALSFYGGGGICQLSVDFIELAGQGALAQAFEMLKLRLDAEGYFAKEHKRKLPSNPNKIALVTSSHGAAIHDFLEIAQNRGLSSKIRLYPTPVQGLGAAEKIARAIDQASLEHWADVIVLIRGGGSLEDLWAFNEEIVCKAIYNSSVPVLTGIGHEIDTSLADLTADIRAATPTHAAQLLWRLRNEIWQNLDTLTLALSDRISNHIQQKTSQWEKMERLLKILSPVSQLANREAELWRLENYFHKALMLLLENRTRLIQSQTHTLARLAPENMIKRRSEKIASLSQSLKKIFASVFEKYCNQLENSSAKLNELTVKVLQSNDLALNSLCQKLTAFNPEEMFKRGYALVYLGRIPVSSASQCQTGEEIKVRLADGVIYAQITKTQLNKDK